jgi:hypothetical protein
MLIIRKKINFLVVLMIIFACLNAGQKIARAAENKLIISPQIIDGTAKAREIINYKIKLSNTGSTTMGLYAIVKELNSKENTSSGTSTSELYDFDKKTSLTRWIRIKRGVIDLNPGQETEIPLDIEVNMNALAGLYHASIIFSPGSSQAEAMARSTSEKQPELLVNITIEDDIIEKAQVVRFTTDKNIFFRFPVSFLTEIRNLGNNKIAPVGSVMIYDRKGQEIETLKINEEARILTPETNIKYINNWVGNSSFGKFKAILNLEYGEKSQRDLSDVIYFWVLPINLIILIGSIFLLIFIIFLYLLVKIIRPKENSGQPRDGTINLKEYN